MQFIWSYLPFSFKGVISKILLQAILLTLTPTLLPPSPTHEKLYSIDSL